MRWAACSNARRSKLPASARLIMQPNEPITKPAAGGPAGRKSTLGWLTQYGIIIAFLLLCVALTFLNKYFLTPENISNILLQTSINGILAMGMTLVILTGGIP